MYAEGFERFKCFKENIRGDFLSKKEIVRGIDEPR